MIADSKADTVYLSDKLAAWYPHGGALNCITWTACAPASLPG